MGEPRHWHLVMYDVSDPKRLRRTHKKLTAWGKPVQYSVFRVRGTGREIERLRCELARILEEQDRLVVVRLCDACAGGVDVRGRELAPFELELPPTKIV